MNRGSEARPYRPTQPLIIGLFLPGQHSREIEGVARTGSRGHRDPEFTVEKTPTANDVVVGPATWLIKTAAGATVYGSGGVDCHLANRDTYAAALPC